MGRRWRGESKVGRWRSLPGSGFGNIPHGKAHGKSLACPPLRHLPNPRTTFRPGEYSHSNTTRTSNLKRAHDAANLPQRAPLLLGTTTPRPTPAHRSSTLRSPLYLLPGVPSSCSCALSKSTQHRLRPAPAAENLPVLLGRLPHSSIPLRNPRPFCLIDPLSRQACSCIHDELLCLLFYGRDVDPSHWCTVHMFSPV